MAVKPIKMFEGTQLANAAATLYTAPVGGGVVKISQITVCNTSASVVHTFSLSIGASSSTNVLISLRPLAPLETQSIPEIVGQLLTPGEVLQMFADTASVVVAQGSGIFIS